jgi:hypothetical protein
MARPSKTDQEQGYFKDMWTELRTIESIGRGTVTVLFNATGRPGVCEVQLIFTPLFGSEQNHLGMQVLKATYPNAEQSTLAGWLWRKAIALGRMVEQAQESSDLDPRTRG